MSSTNLSRRVILAGAASVPALATASALPAAASTDAFVPDPIFAAIEKHRGALISAMRAAWTAFDCDPACKEKLRSAEMEADRNEHAAQFALVETVPTTMAGVFALLNYTEELQTGNVALPEEPDQWHSHGNDSSYLQDFIDEEIPDKFTGEPLDLPFLFWMMRNVRTALRSIAGAAAQS